MPQTQEQKNEEFDARISAMESLKIMPQIDSLKEAIGPNGDIADNIEALHGGVSDLRCSRVIIETRLVNLAYRIGAIEQEIEPTHPGIKARAIGRADPFRELRLDVRDELEAEKEGRRAQGLINDLAAIVVKQGNQRREGKVTPLDKEGADHGKMDRILMEIIDNQEVTDLCNSIERWYNHSIEV